MRNQNQLNRLKNFLRKILTYRKSLIKMNKGKKSTSLMKIFILNMEHSIATINSKERMISYLRKENIQNYILEEIIPSNKVSWKIEFHQLIKQTEPSEKQLNIFSNN
jgi:hypothetical protein